MVESSGNTDEALQEIKLKNEILLDMLTAKDLDLNEAKKLESELNELIKQARNIESSQSPAPDH